MTIKMKKSSSFIPTFHELKTRGTSGRLKIYTYVPPPPPWTPERITGLQFWFDPADDYTDNTSVGLWAKRAGSVAINSVTQATASNKPTRDTHTNGQRVLRFDSSASQYLVNPEGPTILWDYGYLIYVALYDVGSVFSSSPSAVSGGDATDGLTENGINGTTTWRLDGGTYYRTDGIETREAGLGTPHVYTCYRYYQEVPYYIFPHTLKGLNVGRDRTYDYWGGWIGDIVSLNSATSSISDVEEVENYLATKYGL